MCKITHISEVLHILLTKEKGFVKIHMMGKNHMIASEAVGLAMLSVTSYINFEYHGVGWYSLRQNTNFVLRYLFSNHHILLNFGLLFLAEGLFLLGTLLPDIDSKKSILGRYIYLPLEHRTWTHTIWIVLLFSVISRFCKSIWFLTLGYFLHLMEDSISTAGVCFCYPFSRYKVYPSGAKVKMGHKWKFYRAGQSSETSCVVVILFFCSFITLYFGVYLKGLIRFISLLF